MTDQHLIVDIQISADEYLKSYAGVARDVLTQSRDGRSVRFPATILRPFVTRNGIIGSFVIVFDQNKKFKDIKKLS